MFISAGIQYFMTGCLSSGRQIQIRECIFAPFVPLWPVFLVYQLEMDTSLICL